MMNRRMFLGAVIAIVGDTPRAAIAQPQKSHRVGFLGNGSPTAQSSQVEVFRRSLRELGWIEGQNMTIEYR